MRLGVFYNLTHLVCIIALVLNNYQHHTTGAQNLVQVIPHEFLQAVMKASNKRFKIGSQSDPVEFMSWLLNRLHEKLKSSKRKHSIIHECFQGELEVVRTEGANVVTETSRMPFLMLGLDLPPPPLFQDVMEKNIIPQVPFFNVPEEVRR